MRPCTWLCLFVVGITLLGCDTSVPTQTPIELPPVSPLSVEEWKTLPVEVKYDYGTFERLKLQDPKLKNDQEWDKFMVEIVVPERKKDIPDTAKP